MKMMKIGLNMFLNDISDIVSNLASNMTLNDKLFFEKRLAKTLAASF